MSLSSSALVRPTEAADRLGVSIATYWRWVKEGKPGFPKPRPIVPGGRAVAVLESELDSFLARQMASQVGAA